MESWMLRQRKSESDDSERRESTSTTAPGGEVLVIREGGAETIATGEAPEASAPMYLPVEDAETKLVTQLQADIVDTERKLGQLFILAKQQQEGLQVLLDALGRRYIGERPGNWTFDTEAGGFRLAKGD